METEKMIGRSEAMVGGAVAGLLLRGACSGSARKVGMCTELYGRRDWLWARVDQELIEPTRRRGGGLALPKRSEIRAVQAGIEGWKSFGR
jgi:hypothetical protein